MIKHVMVDIETLGLEPNTVIASIGACLFDPNHLIDEPSTFYISLDIENQINNYKRTVTASTLRFWFDQEKEVINQTMNGTVDLHRGISTFVDWYIKCKPTRIWARGIDFDLVILANAFNQTHIEIPWKYNEKRDIRFLDDLVSKDYLKELSSKGSQNFHNSLTDAIIQAKMVQHILAAHNLKLTI